jgi:hypothetical protein
MNTEALLNIISSKSLEKQLKVVESRMSTLQAEMAELEKIKNACLVLMGPQGLTPVEENAPTKTKKKKASDEEALVSEDMIAEDDTSSESAASLN